MICIIPARGGSTRLPRKNLLFVDNKPIIQHVVEIAEASHMFREIIVSTDSRDIADVALASGALPVMRSKEASGDVSETYVLKEVAESFLADAYCRIYPFSILLTPQRIISTSQYVNKYESVMECQRYAHPPQRAFNKVDYIDKGAVLAHTQELPPLFHDAGTLRWFRAETLRIPLPLQSIKWCLVSEMEAQDVDTAEDFEMLKMKYWWRKNASG